MAYDNLPATYRRAVMPTRPIPGSVVAGSVSDPTGPGAYYRYDYGTSRYSSRGTTAPIADDMGGGGNPFTRTAGFIDRNSGQFNAMGTVPNGLPRFLASRQLLFVFWIVAMVLVASNEWTLFPGKFPRPARLWYTSATYGILFLASQVDGLVPICNGLGLGFMVVLLYENVTGQGITLFGHSFTGATSPSAPTPASNQAVINTVTGSGNTPQPGVSTNS
jgi:hypothetical protein